MDLIIPTMLLSLSKPVDNIAILPQTMTGNYVFFHRIHRVCFKGGVEEATRNKKLLGAPGIPTGSWRYY